MSREAFEKWIWEYSYGSIPVTRDTEGCYEDFGVEMYWIAWQAATEAAQQWIPYRAGDVVERGDYLASFETDDVVDEPFVSVDYFNGKEWTEHATQPTAYRQLPEPFVPEVSE